MDPSSGFPKENDYVESSGRCVIEWWHGPSVVQASIAVG